MARMPLCGRRKARFRRAFAGWALACLREKLAAALNALPPIGGRSVRSLSILG